MHTRGTCSDICPACFQLLDAERADKMAAAAAEAEAQKLVEEAQAQERARRKAVREQEKQERKRERDEIRKRITERDERKKLAVVGGAMFDSDLEDEDEDDKLSWPESSPEGSVGTPEPDETIPERRRRIYLMVRISMTCAG